MGTKKKAVKKSKSKSKKSPVAKHVDASPCQEVPDVCDLEDESIEVDAETQDDEISHADEIPEKMEDVYTAEKEEEPAVDQKVPEISPVEAKLKVTPLCHQRIEKLIQSEVGGRSLIRRKLSLQVAADAAQQENRRMSLADAKQIKHPLLDTWTFWYFMGNKYKQWSENLRQVCKFDTVEDFWCLYNELISPSLLSVGKDFSFFKKNIRPEWEDSANKNGGLWSFCPREKNQRNSDMDSVWLEILMFLIGDQFDDLSRHVNGVSYSKRKAQDRISLWIGTELSNTEDILKIGKTLKQAIGHVAHSFKLEYSTSQDWEHKSGSSVIVRHSL